ncbi:preprotein translocase subunit YajC [Cloacibacillus sp. An23]|uniref:preprotein translocase subunit YajC n=1 Tax=Cloacibacillus sp. An23 TaxID=1965591 RepID=UPI0026ACCFE3
MQQQGGLMGMMLPLAMFAAIFYFMIIRPQKKKQRAHEEMLASISRGDTVITAGGFFGVVREILDDSYLIELDEGVKARILKSSISMKKGESSPAPQQPKKKKSKKNEQPAQEAETKQEEALPETAEAQPAEAQPAEAPVQEEKPRQVGAGFEK